MELELSLVKTRHTTTMDKIENGESLDIVQQNIDQLTALFPSIVTEGKIDFEALRQLMGDAVETDPEYYRFTWPGKAQARAEALKPSTGTLRPAPEESLDWDTTQHLYIEGDNLEVLKLLQKSYASKVKMIYIDPPYNTGKDFVYKDNYRDNLANYKEKYNRTDEDGNLLSSAAETNAEGGSRYHSNWLNMMYPRLQLARNLLRDDGVIFISIDDNEVDNLKKICNEIFGEENFVANVIWERAFAPINLKKHFSENHDFLVAVAKSKDSLVCNGLQRSAEANDRYKNPDNDPRGLWQSDNFSVGPIIRDKVYEVVAPGGRVVSPPSGRCWLLTKDRFEEFVKDNRIWFGVDGNNVPRIKRFLSEVKNTVTPFTIWKYSEVGHSQSAAQDLKKVFDGADFFDYPKPIGLLNRIVELYCESSSIILDFFSGSASSAHAVLQHNVDEGKNIKYIQVQLPEPTDAKSEAHKAGYHTIAEIGKERIRRVVTQLRGEIDQKVADKQAEITKLQGELPTEETTAAIAQLQADIAALQGQDLGMKVLKLDSTNIKPWDPDPAQLETNLLSQENIKEGRTEADILYEILLKYGLDLTLPIQERAAGEQLIHSVGGGALFVCLSTGITRATAQAIIDWATELDVLDTEPKVVFRDSGFTSDVEKTNVHQLLQSAGVSDVKSL